ncbi:hypothetical protein WSS15_30210 [Acetobacter pasteurianus]|uniref:aminotransferase class I/II-fold pyridoxal phosphate-dependent enzyme n=1 Tax=Acetobacter pasteurianus TaxID=438 RepID=UPI0022BAC4BD|nr:aminotransferase class I/II-fold pyridoxal phosphate-dependent enzyme [Acetobacter pasteurianus]GLH30371.1 hypothetical protein WSS15_30210 [Acetobacter pasteurianus]
MLKYKKRKENIVDVLFDMVQNQPEKTIFRFVGADGGESDSLTYGSLYTAASMVAGNIQAIAHKNDRIMVALAPGRDFIVGLIACELASTIPVPCHAPKKNGRNWETFNKIVASAQPTAALVSDQFAARELKECQPSIKVININEIEDITYKKNNNRSDLAFIQYTSGSTGDPKGVMVSHRNLMSNVHDIYDRLMCSQIEPGVIWLPPFHDMGLIAGVLLPIATGQPIISLLPQHVIQKPVRWLNAISQYNGIISGGPNFIYDHCVRRISEQDMSLLDLSHWKLAFNGAEPVRASTLDAFSKKFGAVGFQKSAFYPCYGLAEATLFVSGPAPDAPRPHQISIDSEAFQEGRIVQSEANDLSYKMISCGVTSEKTKLQIRSDREEVLPDSQVGKIWISGASVTSGYWKSEEHLPAIQDADNLDKHWLDSGDIGFVQDSQLFICGRTKDLIIIRGRNIYPTDIENTVRSAASDVMADSIVAFSIDEQDSENLIIIAEIKRDYLRDLDTDKVSAKIARAISTEHQVNVSEIIFTKPGMILRTTSGKIRRQPTKKLYMHGKLEIFSKYSPQSIAEGEPRSESLPLKVEQNGNPEDAGRAFLMDWLIQEGLPPFHSDLNAPIFDLGLDSLQWATLAADIEECTGLPIKQNITERFQTIGSLASYIGGCLRIKDTLAFLPEDTRRLILGKGNVAELEKHNSLQDIPSTYYCTSQFPEVRDLRLKLNALPSGPEPFFSTQQGVSGAIIDINSRQYLNYSNHNYLGLAGDPRVIDASIRATQEYGTSTSAARIVGGQKTLHVELEAAIAEFTGHQDAITFVGSNFTNVTVVGHIVKEGDLIIYDEFAHDSLLQGGKLSGADMRPFPHNDLAMLEKILKSQRLRYRKVLIFIEGAYSMHGDIPDLPRIIEIKRKYRSLLMVDECLSIGVVGRTGRGICEHYNIAPEEVDISMGGISKSFGSCGGYIASNAEFISYLRFTTPGFVFTTAMTPANTAAALESIRIVKAEPERVRYVYNLADYFRNVAKKYGLNVENSKHTPVIPVVIGDDGLCIAAYQYLFSQGINVQPIVSPGVPSGAARLRFFVSYEHTHKQIDSTLHILSEFLSTNSALSPVSKKVSVNHD